MINKNKLKCSCGCQSKTEIVPETRFYEILNHIDCVYHLDMGSIIDGYRCPNQLNILIDKAKKGLGNMPATNGYHLKLPIMACDIVHKHIKDIYKTLLTNYENEGGFGLYLNKNGLFSVHLDSRKEKTRWVCVHGKYIYLHSQEKEYRKYLDECGVLKIEKQEARKGQKKAEEKVDEKFI